jgi:LuxR family transcriptional regulator
MGGAINGFASRLALAEAFDPQLDLLLAACGEFGFTSVIYDYAPVPRAHDGTMIAPNLLRTRNVPDSFTALWGQGCYYRIDPVQQICLDHTMPFVWSYRGGGPRILERLLTREHAPVVSYMNDMRMNCGVTVPVHTARGELATVTALRLDPEPEFLREAERQLGAFALLAHCFHASASRAFDRRTRTCPHVRLTPRETECLRWVAEGKTAQDIAVILGRSLATVCLHIANATRKLGAQNRSQAVARAAHYRLLDPPD